MKKLVTLDPVNRLAAVVTSSGTHFKPKHKHHDGFFQSDVRPLTRPWQETTGRDLTGTRFGRFLVVGYSAEKKARWVVKCDCGIYEMRTFKSVSNPANDRDMCKDCRQTHFITKGYSYTDDFAKEERIRREQQGLPRYKEKR